VQADIKPTALPVYAHVKVIKGRTAGSHCGSHHGLDGPEELANFGTTQAVSGGHVVHLGGPQCFVSIDIANAGDDALVEEKLFDSRRAAPDIGYYSLEVKKRIEGISGDVEYRGRHCLPVVHLGEFIYVRSSEHSLVNVSKFDI
jgi:hypothetical protein